MDERIWALPSRLKFFVVAIYKFLEVLGLVVTSRIIVLLLEPFECFSIEIECFASRVNILGYRRAKNRYQLNEYTYQLIDPELSGARLQSSAASESEAVERGAFAGVRTRAFWYKSTHCSPARAKCGFER